MRKHKTYIMVSFAWALIWGTLYLIDFYYENFLDTLYAIISNLLFFGLYLMSIIVVNELNNHKQKQ